MSEVCLVCGEEAKFLCGDCNTAKYCKQEHRNEHWRSHMEECRIIRDYNEQQDEKEAEKKRKDTRKRYFQYFAHNIYDECLRIAYELHGLQSKHIKTTKFGENQINYGVSVCLLVKTLLLIHKPKEAALVLDPYLRQKTHFLVDKRHLCSIEGQVKVSEANKKNALEKLELIADVAALSHQLGRDCLQYYQIYASHTQTLFGAESYELSNVFFCVGCYYHEKHENVKAIACLMRAAGMRGRKGGDCFINIGLIYREMGRLDIGIKMMTTAVKLNEQQYGAESVEYAEAQEKIGLMYVEAREYDYAVNCLEAALKISIKHKSSVDYAKLKGRIIELYKRIKEELDNQNLIRSNQINAPSQNLQLERMQVINVRSFDLNRLFRVPEGFLNSLKDGQLFKFSELQLDLAHCRSEFAVAHTVHNSKFYKDLSQNNKYDTLKLLKKQNQKLFQLMNYQKQQSQLQMQ